MWFRDGFTKANRANKIELEHVEQSFLFFLWSWSQNPEIHFSKKKAFYKYLSRRQNMLEIRHNQIRQSSSVRQKNSKFASIAQVGIFIFQLLDCLQAVGLQPNPACFTFVEVWIYLSMIYRKFESVFDVIIEGSSINLFDFHTVNFLIFVVSRFHRFPIVLNKFFMPQVRAEPSWKSLSQLLFV